MGLINDNDKLVQYRYVVSEFTLIFPDESKQLPEFRVNSFKIENFFDDDVFPIFKMSVILEPSIMYKIIENKNDIKFKVRIQKYYKETDKEKKSLYSDYINDTFSIFLDDSNTEYNYKSANDENGMDQVRDPFDLFLFKDELITNLRQTSNTIISSANMSTVITYILSKVNAKKVLMTPLDNTDVYESIVLPPQSYINQLKYLDNSYGFYKKGAVIFFGLENGYILSYTGGCTAYETNEQKNVKFFVLPDKSSRGYSSGIIHREDDDNLYIFVTTDSISIENRSITDNVTGGTDASIIDMNENSTSTSTSGSDVKGTTNKKVIFNSSSNKYLSDTFAAQSYSNSAVISVGMENVNAELLKPNKGFSFAFESTAYSQQYQGTYRLSSTVLMFEREGEDFKLTASAVFKITQWLIRDRREKNLSYLLFIIFSAE